MTESLPQNIVEAYTQAVRASAHNPEMKETAFEMVIEFCENDKTCVLESSIKRNMLLFWAYSNIAQAKTDDGKFEEALAVWQKAKIFPDEPETRIDVGFKMLEVIDRCRFTIPQKAAKILDVCRYIQAAYLENDDQDGLQKMEHLQIAAEYLLEGSKVQH